jgi:chemotaxis protein MotB
MQDAPMSTDGDKPEDKAKEQEELIKAKEQIEQLIEKNQELNKFKEQLQIDITPNGLSVQLIDDRKRPMFDSGVDVPKDYAAAILRELSTVLKKTHNKISILGHTDSLQYKGSTDYTNWELSADRANAARREFIAGGVKPERFAQVVGLADTIPYDRENPYNPRNRRISIIVLTKEAEENLQKLSSSAPVKVLKEQLQPSKTP